MSNRELRALGLSVNTNNTGTICNTNIAGTAGTESTVETFLLHPYSDNINPSTVEGRKLYLVATKELGEDKKISITIENSLNVKYSPL